MPPEFSASRLGSHFALVPHERARHQIIAKTGFSPGSLIISILSYTSVLLPAEKGRRCDGCHVLSTSNPLRRCSGCVSYWYCDNICQNLDWQRQHKRICKHYNRYIASGFYQALAPHEKLDALLLSHLAARISLDGKAFEEDSSLNTFMSLLPGPATRDLTPPVCGSQKALAPEQLYALYSRFGNNNFVIHSHLTTFGHGIFPLASRLFNHSCMPNAAAKYQIQQSQLVQMEVVALREILPNEEICLPYLDPALLQERSKIFELTYGFTCDCFSCSFLASVSPIPAIPKDSESQETLVRLLHKYVTGMVHSPLFTKSDPMPVELLPVLNESYLSNLSEKFSAASHDGPFDVALDIGKVILDLYNLIYPPNYPQIGMHLLEMAKTAWNNVVSTGSGDVQQVRDLLQSADKILSILGPEGDDGGPLQEIEILKSLLST